MSKSEKNVLFSKFIIRLAAKFEKVPSTMQTRVIWDALSADIQTKDL